MSGIPAVWRFPGTTQEPLQHVTKTDLAYPQIRQKILEGQLAPGTSLNQEALAADLGLSTTPVREALRRLEAERLVVSRAHRDMVVAPLSVTTVEDVYAVRLSLDPLAAALAAARAVAEEKEKILALSHESPVEDDPVSHVYLNRQLHRSIYAASGNSVLTECLDSLWDLSDRYRLITLKDNKMAKIAQEQHAAIVAAVVVGNPDRAAELMREHLAESLQRIRASVAD